MSTWTERAIAFAGMAQAGYLVNTIARKGLISQDMLDGCLETVFVTNPEHAGDVYAFRPGLLNGLSVAGEMLQRFNREHADVVRYVFALMQLERRLSGEPEALRELGARISCIDEKRMLASSQSDEVPALLGDLYDEILSQFPPRVTVYGEQSHLENQVNVLRVRALLLAGVRSAVLFRQLGGRSWRLVFQRGALREATLAVRQQLVQNP